MDEGRPIVRGTPAAPLSAMIWLAALIAIVLVIVGGAWWLGRGLGANEIPTKEHPDVWWSGPSDPDPR